MAGLLSIAFAFRLFFLVVKPHVLDTADAVHYLDVASHFAKGDFWGINAKIPVFYPLLTTLAHLAVNDLERAACLVSLAAGTLMVLSAYWLACDLHGKSTARLVGLMVAVWPWLIDYACRVAPDILGSTLWLTGVLFLARAVRRGGVWMWFAPWPFLCLHLTRAEGTFVMLAGIVAALILCVPGDTARLKRLGPFVFTAIVFFALYTLYIRSLTGAATVNYRTQFIVREFDLVKMLASALKTFNEVVPIMLGPAMLLFIGVGLFGGQKQDAEEAVSRDVRLELFVLFFAAVQWALILSVLSPEPRYLMSVLVVFSMWSARGAVVVSSYAAQKPHGSLLRFLPAAAIVGSLLLGDVVSLTADRFRDRPLEPLEYREVGLWMKENLEPGLIFTRKPQVGFYAGMLTTGPDTKDSLEQAIERAMNVKARYVVVDERYTAEMVPSLVPLLNPSLAPASLKLVKEFQPFPRCRVVVYELAQAPDAPPKQ